MSFNKYKSIPKRISSLISKIAKKLISPIEKIAYKDFNNFPFGTAPLAKPETYLNIWNNAKKKSYPLIDNYVKKKGYSIDLKWFHTLALSTQVVIKKSDICYQHGRLLYSCLSEYISKHSNLNLNVLETGTARGFSSLCMAKAMLDLNQKGKIMTIDVIPHKTPLFWNCISDKKGPLTRVDLIKDYQNLVDNYIIFIHGDSQIQLNKISMSRIHFAFLDGMHTYKYLLNEFAYIKNQQHPGDIIFFDDYTPKLFPEIVKAVDEICKYHNYSKEIITLNKERGYVVAQKLD